MSFIDPQETIYLFDFDGTLVPQTNFVDEERNILLFTKFITFINPSAFGVRWGIVTNRPKIDASLIRVTLKNNNILDTDILLTYDGDMPPPSKLEDIVLCKDKLIKDKLYRSGLITDSNDYFLKNRVYYVDNDEKIRNKMSDLGYNCMSVIEFIQKQNDYWKVQYRL